MIILPLPAGSRLIRRFHIAEAARRRYDVREEIIDLRGRVMVAEPAVAERLAASINAVRDVRRFPESGVSGAEIFAAALLDEAVHLILDAYRKERDPEWLARLENRLVSDLGEDRVAAARLAFVRSFPSVDVFAGRLGADEWLAGRAEDLPNRQVALEERVAVRLANENPALSKLHELVDEAPLGEDDRAVVSLMQGRMSELPGLPGAAADGEDDLWSMLRAPMRASPTSLEGQLAYVRRHWGGVLGPAMGGLLDRLVASLDLLAERRAGGPPGPPGPAPVLDARALRGPREEVEAFSEDADWMPQVVMVAKNAYVWLDQLSKAVGREVRRLDEVPDEALAEMRSRGFSALWLIGLWQRSEASARIKRMRGQEDAVASAYALEDYRIADDLGGEEAWRHLRDRAAAHGIRLASDMVPNHVGIDGRWVVEHPDRFVQLDHPPYPGYTFTGADLSGDPRIQVRIEDGYWESRDAAVVFERIDSATGERRYLYHGNDGTTMPWNDTAQLDYLKPDVREAVIQVILDVARRFPIIRFDAAMTLAKQHVQRLWYPPPGHGGAIPSRSTYGSLPDEEFERRMPVEFWREVVDRVAEETPGTLLLAEAFWMMEGYFVRTLGMHRVYNSAFMNMMAREANGEYQQLMRNVLDFDPQILGRFVNFMNNPDEETAIEQFGDGDKAFGVATLMATLPGLPMFGHGQVEGLREKYGMEYRRAKLDEAPNPHLIERHRREIAPLLARRGEFAGTPRFRLLEVEGEHGRIDDVYAYANGRPGGPTHLVLFHNRYGDAHGRVRRTAPFTSSAGGGVRVEELGDALSLSGGDDRFLRYREHRSGLEYLVRSDAWRQDGLEVRLGAYECRVLMDLHEIHDTDGRWRRLHDHLGGRGVPDLEDAFRDLELRPVHEAFSALLRASEPDPQADARGDAARTQAQDFGAVLSEVVPDAAFEPARAAQFLRRAEELDAEGDAVPGRAWLRAWATAAGFDRPAHTAGRLRLGRLLEERVPPAAEVDGRTWAAIWHEVLPADAPAYDDPSGSAARAGPSATTETGGSDAPAPDAAAPETGAKGDAPSAVAASDPSARRRDEIEADLEERAEDEAFARILGVNEHEGIRWFRREPFRAFTAAWVAARGISGAPLRRRSEWATRWAELESAAGYDFERLVRRDAEDADDRPLAGGTAREAAGPSDDAGDRAGGERTVEREETTSDDR